MKRLISTTLLLASIAACTTTSDKPADSAVAANPAPISEAPAPTPIDSTTPPTNDWTVTSSGIGNIRAGMSVAELKKAFGDSLVIPAKLEECDYIRPKSRPAGVLFMINDKKLARVDIRDSSSIKTAEGAGIGDTEDRIKSLYAGEVTVQPHKYTDGHYLVVKQSGAAADERIIFETDGKKVTQFRAGKMPAVEYVEGCS